jgi:hypothetical protein
MLQTQQLDFLFGRLHKSLVKKIYPFTPSRLCYWIDVHGRKKNGFGSSAPVVRQEQSAGKDNLDL